ncbi:MAG: ATP-binding protein [Acidobacteriota bacterium]
MLFLGRNDEIERLAALATSEEGGLAVLHGRRRIGKTRLLLEWANRHDGLYTVADQSAPEIQRRYLAQSIASRFPGFADVTYPDWSSLFDRLGTEAQSQEWRGPLILDELPYLVATSPEVPSVLQRFVDHHARQSRLVLAVAGSSQRMMQGIVLSANAPLYGRARVLLKLGPLEPGWVLRVWGETARDAAEFHAAWGGVPRHWELAVAEEGSVPQQVEHLVLDPLGPLHSEPDRLLVEEIPTSREFRPLLDAIGSGAHRVSEIAGRLGRPATSLARPLDRLQEMDLIRREVPFGEDERKSKRSVYRMNDPFVRLWFRVVAPHRAALASGTSTSRRRHLEQSWKGLLGSSWEDLTCDRLPHVDGPLSKLGAWEPGRRWWQGAAPEWDVVSRSDSGDLLLGEAKWSSRPVSKSALERMVRALESRDPPSLGRANETAEAQRVLFVPELAKGVRKRVRDVLVVTAAELIGKVGRR